MKYKMWMWTYRSPLMHKAN